jgi:hypothetical protein
MLRLILIVLAIMVFGAIIGSDCLTCGHSNEIRNNIRNLFNRDIPQEAVPMKSKRRSNSHE